MLVLLKLQSHTATFGLLLQAYDTEYRAVVGSAVILIQLTEGQKVQVVNSESKSVFGTFEPDNTVASWFSGIKLT